MTIKEDVDTMKDKSNFIVTTDKKTADKLISEGFRLIANTNGKFTFENKPLDHFTFSTDDLKNMVYTNILTF